MGIYFNQATLSPELQLLQKGQPGLGDIMRQMLQQYTKSWGMSHRQLGDT